MSYEDVTARVQGAVKPGATDADAERAAQGRDVGHREGVRRRDRPEVRGRSRSTAAASTGSTATRNTRTSASCSRPRSRSRTSAATTTTSRIPRWNFDITFFRVYENGQPAKTDALPEVVEGRRRRGRADLRARLSGLDGAAADRGAAPVPARRRATRSQMQVWTSRRDALVALRGAGRRAGAGARRRAALGLENSIKRLVGQQDGLMNPRIFTKKEDDEAALRAKVAANPEWQKAYAPAWDQIAAAYAGLPALREAHRVLEPHAPRGSPAWPPPSSATATRSRSRAPSGIRSSPTRGSRA